MRVLSWIYIDLNIYIDRVCFKTLKQLLRKDRKNEFMAASGGSLWQHRDEFMAASGGFCFKGLS
jgi:hypothetical protein